MWACDGDKVYLLVVTWYACQLDKEHMWAGDKVYLLITTSCTFQSWRGAPFDTDREYMWAGGGGMVYLLILGQPPIEEAVDVIADMLGWRWAGDDSDASLDVPSQHHLQVNMAVHTGGIDTLR